MKCSKCAKEMTSPDGTTVEGMRLRFIFPSLDDSKEWIKTQLGKYPLQDYDFCYECWLDSLFGGQTDHDTV